MFPEYLGRTILNENQEDKSGNSKMALKIVN